jgi:uncharacterized YigZ family protein
MASYKTILTLSTGKYVEKGSRFIAYALHVLSEKEALDFVEGIKKEHHKARHVCYAYSIGTLNLKERMNDDGEPAHTAGQPIMNQIKKSGLNYTVIAIARYFGGVLLGKGGLIQAYGTAAANAIQSSQIVEKNELVTLDAKFHISHYTEVMELIKKNKLILLSEIYDGEFCFIECLCEPENEKIISALLKF